MFISCSRNHSYEDQISRILVYDDEVGEYTDGQIEKVFKLIEDNPETLDYDFSEELPMIVVTSDDGKVRAYVIEKYDFGGNPSAGFETSTLIQYKVGNEIYTTHLDEEFPIVKSIAHLSDNFYLIIDWWGFIAQGEHNHNRARVFKIDEWDLKMCSNIFRDNENNKNQIEIYWNDDDFLDDSMPNYYELQEKLIDEANADFDLGIVYNKNLKDLYIPNIIHTPHQYEIMDGTFSRFYWTGKYFIDATLMDPLERMNNDYFIRIEQESDGSCTYRCWNGGVIIGKPALTIRNGNRQVWGEYGIYDYNKWISLDESYILGETYSFENKGYRYIYRIGRDRGYKIEDLEVYDPKGELVYSGRFEPVH